MERPKFLLTRFKTNDAGGTDIELEFNIGHGKVVDKQTFQWEENARNYVQGSARDFLLIIIERFVKHKKILAAASKYNYYNSMSYLRAMEKFQDFFVMPRDETLLEICKKIVRMELEFVRILPRESNPSYKNAVADMEYILEFCRQRLVNHKTR